MPVSLQEKYGLETSFTKDFLGSEYIISELNNILGLEMHSPTIEINTNFLSQKRVDVVCKLGKNEVIIENQFGDANFDHFGKVVSHLFQNPNYKYGILIAESFDDIFFINAVTSLNRELKNKKVILVKAIVIGNNVNSRVIFSPLNKKDIIEKPTPQKVIIEEKIEDIDSNILVKAIEYLKSDNDITSLFPNFGVRKSGKPIDKDYSFAGISGKCLYIIHYPHNYPCFKIFAGVDQLSKEKADYAIQELNKLFENDPATEISLSDNEKTRIIVIKRNDFLNGVENNAQWIKRSLFNAHKVAQNLF